MLFIVGKVKKTDGTEDPTSLPSEGKITIKSFYLRVPIIEYNSEAQIKLIKELFDNSYFSGSRRVWLGRTGIAVPLRSDTGGALGGL